MIVSLFLLAVASCPTTPIDDIGGNEALLYECVEQVAACGSDGYPIGYGKKYAERFYRHARPKMTSRGKQFIDNTLVCLQEELQSRIDDDTSCQDIRTIAFDTHPACYVASGFCELPVWDWLMVAGSIDGWDWLSQDALRQVWDTARICLSA